MSNTTPEQRAIQFVAPIIETDTGRMIGVGYGHDRIIDRWAPEQADDLEAVGRLMIELATRLREVGERHGGL